MTDFPESNLESDSSAAFMREEIEPFLPDQNKALFRSIIELSRVPEGDKTSLYAAILNARFFVPLDQPARLVGEGQEESLDVLVFETENGEMVLPVFTHIEALQAWNPEAPAVTDLSGDVVLQLLIGSPIQLMAVNPAGPFGGYLQRWEIERLAEGAFSDASVQDVPDLDSNNVYIDLPLEPLPDLTLKWIVEWLESSLAVQRAYLFIMQTGGRSVPSLTLGLDTVGPAGQWIAVKLQRLLQNNSLSFASYDVPNVILIANLPGADALRDNVPPLFSRSDALSNIARLGSSQPDREAPADSGSVDPVIHRWHSLRFPNWRGLKK